MEAAVPEYPFRRFMGTMKLFEVIYEFRGVLGNPDVHIYTEQERVQLLENTRILENRLTRQIGFAPEIPAVNGHNSFLLVNTITVLRGYVEGQAWRFVQERNLNEALNFWFCKEVLDAQELEVMQELWNN